MINPTQITDLLSNIDNLPHKITDPTTITIYMSLFEIIIKLNPDDSITVNEEITYPNLDQFTSNFFYDYI